MRTTTATDAATVAPDDDSVSLSSLTPLRYFSLYRLLMTSALLAIVLGFAGDISFGRYNEVLFSRTALAYWAFALVTMLGADRALPTSGGRLTLGVLADIFFLTLLTYASGGASSGLPFMHVVVLAFAALVGQGRLAVFYAAVASLAMLFEQSIQAITTVDDATTFVQVGTISIGFFATAIAVRLLARRVIANELLARERGRDLAEQVRVNERVIRDMEDGVLVVDPDGRVTQANPQAHRLLDPTMPRPVTLADFSPALDDLLSGIASADRERVMVLDLPARPAAVRVRCVPAGGQGGHLLFIEDLARLREQARQIKLAALGRLTASMAHEIRNPLSAITQAAELLQEERRAETQARLTRIICDNSLRLDRLVSDVLELGRRDRAEPELLDLAVYARNFVEELAMRDASVRSRVRVDAPAAGVIWFDRGHLHQVLWNLVVNALRYASQGLESVRIIVRSEDDATLIEVLDDGPGIDIAVRTHLFEPFFTTHSKGTGLGLYIARELCEANGARLDFVDNSPGAHFRVRGMNRSWDGAWNVGDHNVS
ncbi:MAG: ATP-binding protein [Methyloversatilis sp.]|uniref:sensor histidine kinase n=1 Tax=Methyloversatilis sp. TaxID=2569862 RepID=UPI002735BD4C|nr:ATP-binding protein [Methyloversatilis sp.]MDP3873330.1 ATP-binding protein [Methyloversatilis sp.]